MRVTYPGGSFEFGQIESSPTISMIDFSRRVTDDFGVTTVVERGFARKMSIRLAVPTVEVDNVQRQLAALRAVPATWMADELIGWLNFKGFYKDFEIDLALPPLSYCTLTVEGLAEAEVVADAGGDVAPLGSTSTLRLLQPATITSAMIVASSIPETDFPEWSGATSYAMGAKVRKAATHRTYESITNANAGNDPATPTGHWVDIGPTNRWAMLDDALGTSTEATGSISLTLAPGPVTALALLDVTAATVRVQTTDYDRTQAAGTGAVAFLDIPGTGGNVTVTVTGPGTVSVGTLLVGQLVTLGVTLEAPTAGIIDFSRKGTDDFGEVTVVPRSWAKRMSAKAMIRTNAVDQVANRLASVRARPCLWIGDDQSDCLTIFGFFKDFSIEVAETVSTLDLSIEGLSQAAELGLGLGLANWTDVIDNDPNRPKPEDGATVGAPNGTNIGNVPVETLITQHDAMMAEMDALFAAGASTALAEVNQTKADLAAEVLRAKADTDSFRTSMGILQNDIAGTAASVGSEAIVRANADTALANRLTVVESSVGGAGGDLSALTARIATEETTRANADSALANRTSMVESIVNHAGSGNAALLARVGAEETTRATNDTALANRLVVVESSVGGGGTDLSALTARIATEETTRANADTALSNRVTSTEARAGSLEARTSITESSISTLEGYAAARVKLEAIAGTGRAELSLWANANGGGGVDIVGDVRFKGLQIHDSGTVMIVSGLVNGVGFGTSNQFIYWYGPSKPIHQCDEASALEYRKANGSAYISGALLVGVLTTRAGTSDISTSAIAETAVFGSNGRPITVSLSYAASYLLNKNYPDTGTGSNSFLNDRQAVGANTMGGDGFYRAGGSDPGGWAVELYRGINGGAYALVATLTGTGTWQWGGAPPGAGEPGTAQATGAQSGSLTFTDPQNVAQDRQYKAVLTTRNPKFGVTYQNISLLCMEE